MRAPLCILLAGAFDVGCTTCGIMNPTFKAALYETHGNPAEGLRIVELPWPEPAPNEVGVKRAAAPFNPADRNAIEGKYPVLPALPATPGMEGAGIVVELGSGVRNLAVGTLVILPHGLGKSVDLGGRRII